jgi:hypothetical protein
MTEILEKTKQHHNIELDSKQLKAYKMICATFMIKLIRDQISGTSSEHDHTEQAAKMNRIIEGLKSLGGKDQLIMFLTGPASAGKTTSIKLAQTFCEKFSLACSIPFDEYSFYFTAYTGAAASEYGGITTKWGITTEIFFNTLSNAPQPDKSNVIPNPPVTNNSCIQIGYIVYPQQKTSQSHVRKCPTGRQFSG